MHLRLLFTLITPLIFTLSAGAYTPDSHNSAISDSIVRRLGSTTDPQKRLTMLYDIFDLAPADSVNSAGERVLQAAREARDTAAIYDMYRRLASFNQAKNSELIKGYLDEVSVMPASPERDATKTFIYLCSLISEANFTKENERFNKIAKLITRYQSLHSESDDTNRMLLLFSLCKYLELTMPSELLTNYLNELETIIRRQPYQLDALLNMFYLNAAMIYTSNDQPAQAVAADRELLKAVDRLEKSAKAHGHNYRNYDKYRYTVYRRMLSNYEALSPQEIEMLYTEINKLCARVPAIARDMAETPHAEAYYLIAKGRFSQAKVPLKKALSTETRFGIRLRLYKMLIKAAEKDGDTELLNHTLKAYTQMLEEAMKQRSLERGRQLAVLYGAGLINDPSDISESAKEEEDRETRHTIYLLILSTVVGLLLIVTVLFIVLYRRSHALSHKLLETNDLLTAERDNLKRTHADLIKARDEARRANRHKSDFIYNMSHEVSTPLNTLLECSHLIVDNANAEKRPYLQHFARTIDISADMLRTLINDVLEINNLEGGALPVQRTNVSLQSLCHAALESVKKHVPAGVELIWSNAGEPDKTIYTDAGRVEQVIINMLSNALKFTETGKVIFDYSVDNLNGTTTFTVTDTGCGVPEGKEEIIFERFEKLSPLTQGTGLGLSISRMIANLLHGKIYLDTTYTAQGARFIFTIPSKP